MELKKTELGIQKKIGQNLFVKKYKRTLSSWKLWLLRGNMIIIEVKKKLVNTDRKLLFFSKDVVVATPRNDLTVAL